MKIKLNWGTSIVIAMVLFIIFILQFVYRTLAVDKYNHELVSDDYYKDELYYQQELDKLNNAAQLPQNISIEHVKDGLLVTFPSSMDIAKISGKVYFQRPSKQKLDFNKDIQLTDSTMLIKDERLVSGKWNVKIDWKYGEKEYLLKESMYY